MMLDLKAARWGPPSKNLALEVLQDMESSRTEAGLQGFQPSMLLSLLITSGVNK